MEHCILADGPFVTTTGMNRMLESFAANLDTLLKYVRSGIWLKLS